MSGGVGSPVSFSGTNTSALVPYTESTDLTAEWMKQIACLGIMGASFAGNSVLQILMSVMCVSRPTLAQTSYPTCNCTFYDFYRLITPEAFAVLGETPCGNTTLDLSNSGITPALLDVLNPAIAQMCSLQDVDLSGNLLGSNPLYLKQLLRDFAIMRITSSLNLSIGSNNLSVGFSQLIPFLGVPSLTVSSNRIDSAQAQALAKVMKTAILYLDLSHNTIKDSGAQAFAPLVPSAGGAACLDAEGTVSIYLGFNGIGDPGAQAIAVSLAAFSFQGYCSVSSACSSCLKTLDLSGNPGISTAGAAAIVAAISANKNCWDGGNAGNFLCYYPLQNLNLCGTTVPYEVCANMYTILSAALPYVWFGCGANYTSSPQYSCEASPPIAFRP